MSKLRLVLLFSAWLVVCLFVFNKCAYEISQANAKIRILVTQQKLALRSFVDGIPVSYSSKHESFVSPFYVVHYGIYFSEGMEASGRHWEPQKTLKYWNVKPERDLLNEKQYYFNAAIAWLKENKKTHKGHLHFLYNFDWKYRSHPEGGLSAPWWSGLTDGYAIILMLRAYDRSQDKEYLDIARELYLSTTAKIEEGGSLNALNGCPWIEEYVDPRIEPGRLSHVLNGAVYAAYGVEAYEQHSEVKSDQVPSEKLYACIKSNVEIFDRGIWSNYDALGNSANIKYHRINFFLLKNMIDSGKIAPTKSIQDTLNRWEIGVKNPGYGYIKSGPKTTAYYHYVGMFFVVLIFPFMLPVILRRVLKSGRKADKV